jgi:hypothetical protein
MSAGVRAAEWSQWSMRMRLLVTDPAALHCAFTVVRTQLHASRLRRHDFVRTQRYARLPAAAGSPRKSACCWPT